MDTVVAVDLGATNVRTACIERDGSILQFDRETVAGIADGREITARIIDLIDRVSDGYHPHSIGISTAGPINLHTGCVEHSPNMRASSISLIPPLSKKFRCHVRMLTDCKAGALGEYTYGSGNGCENLVYITFSTGIGCGVLEQGKIVSGNDGNAGEVGHFIVDTSYPVMCGCGEYGHWEAYCSGIGIPKFFSVRYPKRSGLSADEILTRANNGDEPYVSFARELTELNTRGLQSVICAYNPSLIVLDGPIARHHPELFSGNLDSYLHPPKMIVSTLTGNAPLLGAAAYAFQDELNKT